MREIKIVHATRMSTVNFAAKRPDGPKAEQEKVMSGSVFSGVGIAEFSTFDSPSFKSYRPSATVNTTYFWNSVAPL